MLVVFIDNQYMYTLIINNEMLISIILRKCQGQQWNANINNAKKSVMDNQSTNSNRNSI